MKKVAVSISADRDYLAGRARGEGGMAAGQQINVPPGVQFRENDIFFGAGTLSLGIGPAAPMAAVGPWTPDSLKNDERF
jgi:hypothetical protein